MPSYKGQLSDDDIYSLVEYLKTVSDYYTAETTGSEEASPVASESAAADSGEESEAEATDAEE
jgi:hypothetical protein